MKKKAGNRELVRSCLWRTQPEFPRCNKVPLQNLEYLAVPAPAKHIFAWLDVFWDDDVIRDDAGRPIATNKRKKKRRKEEISEKASSTSENIGFTDALSFLFYALFFVCFLSLVFFSRACRHPGRCHRCSSRRCRCLAGTGAGTARSPGLSGRSGLGSCRTRIQGEEEGGGGGKNKKRTKRKTKLSPKSMIETMHYIYPCSFCRPRLSSLIRGIGLRAHVELAGSTPATT